ncbi:hypothetical protein TWF225_005467 [Orbilia oligospora]|uniref:Uncharacterized protein n=1 Tax=Orbilia oligospora TaxID=2813651 RepID=A0A7C8PGL7_ORBOL|nr:hypothetical protein TWF751_006473 [Orbilia oligospora]KAF3194850.1 hypothetical protein TWF225_005467 [Orbilia oligospora]KAF3259902.1 hypothetical protein TWF128_003892 [Orbilia oligospora]KAF3270790.1 hypothetical protein TWF217_007065 [Orbilia oligospora]KAF3292275.1 hypothetical protein TWF132_005665 [Orbilia oligospora]
MARAADRKRCPSKDDGCESLTQQASIVKAASLGADQIDGTITNQAVLGVGGIVGSLRLRFAGGYVGSRSSIPKEDDIMLKSDDINFYS